ADVVFAETARHLATALKSRAGAVIAEDGAALGEKPGLLVAHPRLAFARALALLYPEPAPAPGVHPTAVLGRDVTLGESTAVGAKVSLGDGVRIGRRGRIEAGAALGAGVSVGEEAFIGPNVAIYPGVTIGDHVRIHGGTVVGADGFGYVFDRDHYEKIPQVGGVIIEDDVELGAGVCIDRATTGATRIGRGTKIDNQVQIGHNDVIGQHVILTGQCGISGSVHIGDYTVFGARTGVADHLQVGARVRTGMVTGIMANTPDGQTLWGVPARPVEEMKELYAALNRLPVTRYKLLRWLARVGGLEARLRRLER
ncbi:MAG: UDP-3-O-(3-hydroxymyristoyl)glucosamine N-acyltransferase, partial [Dehalococcoidia bacterium]|nr:UDP-3-O-(3-hydroxymyristoyl)glucosamine N-acyltransferase [Dehalococcoidia bacterium]